MIATDYTNAPATSLLATHCVACGRPLLDAASVEAALGPTCRERFGVHDVVSDEARREANALISRLATRHPGGLEVVSICDRLRALGMEALAGRVEERTVAIRIAEYDHSSEPGYLVISPYSEEANARFRAIDGRRFLRDPVGVEGPGWWFPVESRNALWRAVQASFSGQLALGPKGAFLI